MYYLLVYYIIFHILFLCCRLTNAINTRGKQLVMRLNEVCDQKQNTLNEKKVALDQLSKLTDHCILFGTHVLKKGSDMELLYSKKYILFFGCQSLFMGNIVTNHNIADQLQVICKE